MFYVKYNVLLLLRIVNKYNIILLYGNSWCLPPLKIVTRIIKVWPYYKVLARHFSLFYKISKCLLSFDQNYVIFCLCFEDLLSNLLNRINKLSIVHQNKTNCKWYDLKRHHLCFSSGTSLFCSRKPSSVS